MSQDDMTAVSRTVQIAEPAMQTQRPDLNGFAAKFILGKSC